jgi:hypothetical protein
MKTSIQPPKDHKGTPSAIPEVLIDPDTEQVEWTKSFNEDGTWKITGYNIVKKQIYNG